jgi:hypothetical protein
MAVSIGIDGKLLVDLTVTVVVCPITNFGIARIPAGVAVITVVSRD